MGNVTSGHKPKLGGFTNRAPQRLRGGGKKKPFLGLQYCGGGGEGGKRLNGRKLGKMFVKRKRDSAKSALRKNQGRGGKGPEGGKSGRENSQD